MGGNKVYIGWGTDSVLRLQVDTTNFGHTWPININGTAAVASSVAWSNVSGRPTALSAFTNDGVYLTGNQSITLSGAVKGSGTTSIATTFANTYLSGIDQSLTTTSSPTFAGFNTSSTYGACGVFTGNADNAAYSAYNLKIKSWWGIGFESYDNITRILFDTRTGNISTKGTITANGGITGNLTGNASTASSVAWNNVSGRPTALSAFTNDSGYLLSSTAASTYLPIGGTASNATALGGVNSDFFVQGTGFDANSTFGKRTTSFSFNSATPSSTCLTDPLKSGFYDGEFKAGQTPNSSWAFVINTAHSNQQSNSKFQFQIAAGFGNKRDTTDWGAENYWMRVINGSGIGDWHTLLHSDNYSSFNNFTSGLVTTGITSYGASNLTLTSDYNITMRNSNKIFMTCNASAITIATGITATGYNIHADTFTADSGLATAYITSHGASNLTLTSDYNITLGNSNKIFMTCNASAITAPAIICNGSLRVKYQEKSADYTVTDRDCGTIIAMTNTGFTMTVQAGSNYTAGFSVDISGPGGGAISSNIHFTDAWYLNGNTHAAGTNLGLRSETASIRYVAGSWYVSLP
jgi:hypothetical protein